VSLMRRLRPQGGPPFDHIGAADAAAAVDAGAVLLDVRESGEWNAGRAPQAWHLPMGQLADGHSKLPRDKRIVVVCRSGNRSARACQHLAREGFDVANLEGGMVAWARAGLPVVAGNGLPGRIA